MRYLIFSDTHLTPHIEPEKAKILIEAVRSVDRVIINGDFWEGFRYSFEEFVNSDWNNEFFPLLKKKKAIYLYGNHDKERFSNEKRSVFSDNAQYVAEITSGGKKFRIEHGDKLFPLPDITGWQSTILEFIEDSLMKIFGMSFPWLVYRRMNIKIKKDMKGKLNENEYLVIGHTHFPEIDLINHFINDGFMKHGYAYYTIIDEGKVTQIKKRF